ncbi:MAG TPA: DUF6049 family protein, partial [Mycobacteriales bacterium]|nr:DUF6049 family protein [Mycobacteriales bacterium]
SLEPRDIRPDSTLTVVATLRNPGVEDTGPLRFRLQRGSVLTTRSELDGTDADPPPTGAAFAPPSALDGGLAPGQATRVTYRAPAADLAMSRLGVYPLAFVVQSADGDTVGRVQTLLPHFPPTIDTAGTRVALLWPLLDRPHRLTGGRDDTTEPGQPRQPPVFLDDSLYRSVAAGGRLDRLLSVAERVSGSVRLTLVIDPETIEELDRMTAGYRVAVSAARTLPGQGGPAAAAWLARLKKIAGQHLLVAVPYGDPDLVALERGGNAALARVEQPDIDATARVLGVTPTTKVAWPPDGLLTDKALDDVVSAGAGVVLLDRTALPDGPSPDGSATPSAASPLPALGGQAIALVPDATLQRLLAGGAQRRSAPRLAEQRLLAELAMVTAERPSDSRTLVLAPPRRWDPPAAYARALVTDLGELPWLSSVTALDAAGTTAPVDRGALVYPASAQRTEISAALVQQIGAVEELVADFRGALGNADANAELSPYGDALRRAGSTAWRGNQRAGLAYVQRLRRQISVLRARVTMTAPITGVYTLASTDSPLVLTLQNDLEVPVKVRIRLDTPPGFATGDVGIIEIPAGQKRSVRVPASVQRTGTFLVRGQLTTPGQGVLGQEITLSVRSRAYGGLALGITGLAFAVLVGAVIVRLVRRLRGPGPAAPVAGTPADRSRV